jgi:hypothetical protein
MADSTFLQKVFCDISLERKPDLWQDDADTEDRNVERIEFLATFPQTEYRAQLNPAKSTTKKNGVLAKALREKGNKSYGAGDNIEAMNHYNQALRFATTEEQVGTSGWYRADPRAGPGAGQPVGPLGAARGARPRGGGCRPRAGSW